MILARTDVVPDGGLPFATNVDQRTIRYRRWQWDVFIFHKIS